MKTIRELCITVTMRLVTAGHALCEAQELAVLAVLGLLMLCNQNRDRVVLPEETRPVYCTVLCGCSSGSRLVNFVLPAAAGAAGAGARRRE